MITNFSFHKERPLLISGPCSAETEEQLINTVKELHQLQKVHLIRAGIWKPRTKPGMFEGVGAIGLQWLQSAKEITGLPVTVEIANASHVEQALKHNVDVLWIGARTTVNPFSVQEIADSLKGVNIPVLIKNPVSPDIELWAGAVERIVKSGITEIGLVHRGFSSFGNSKYRNPPMWQLAIEMKRQFSNLPMICDPSHIAGNRTLLQEIAQQSIDLDFDGLMIESHIDPNNAWSDASQQITPIQLNELLNNLIWRSSLNVENEDHLMSLLNSLRNEMDQIDDELIGLLGNRMELADKIGALKKERNITILQKERWNQIFERISSKAIQAGLSEEFVKKYYDAVHLESISHQNKIMNG
jgi:chorismate mutase